MKKVSFISLLTVILFTAITFSKTDVEENFSNYNKFGWPRTFFVAAPENLNNAKDAFSFLSLSIDILFCVAIAFIIKKIIDVLKVERKKGNAVTQIIPAKQQRFSIRRSL